MRRKVLTQQATVTWSLATTKMLESQKIVSRGCQDGTFAALSKNLPNMTSFRSRTVPPNVASFQLQTVELRPEMMDQSMRQTAKKSTSEERMTFSYAVWTRAESPSKPRFPCSAYRRSATNQSLWEKRQTDSNFSLKQAHIFPLNFTTYIYLKFSYLII